jgi:hypothetical protein
MLVDGFKKLQPVHRDMVLFPCDLAVLLVPSPCLYIPKVQNSDMQSIPSYTCDYCCPNSEAKAV